MMFKYSFLIVALGSTAWAQKPPPAEHAAGHSVMRIPLMARGGCDCSIYPIHPDACLTVCGQTRGTVVAKTDDRLTLETLEDGKKEARTYALQPELQGKIHLERGTEVRVTYRKSDMVVGSVWSERRSAPRKPAKNEEAGKK